MKKVISYSGIVTKVKAMSSNLISLKDYNTIAAIETVPEFITFLKNHPGYSDIFKKYQEHELHRADTESIFINALYLDYAKLLRFANKKQKKELELLLFRYEVSILKNCIRMIFSKEDALNLSIYEEFFHKYSNLDITSLSALQNIDEFLLRLRKTEYYDILSKLNNANNATSFDYELQLDLYYFKKVWELKDIYLQGFIKKSYTNRLGTEIDLLNIMWIYRSKLIYDMNSSDIYKFIIPIKHKLSKQQLVKMIEAVNRDEFLAILKSTHYKAIYTSLSDGTSEIVIRDTLLRIDKLTTAKFPSSIAPVYYYLNRKEIEISRLTTALECIRYGLEPQEKLRYILQ